MILGVGVDIIEIDRIKESVEKYGDAFLNKIFTKTELEYSLSKKNKHQHLAARFAAKEAVYKALISGLKKTITWKEIEVFNMPDGTPQIKLSERFNEFLEPDKYLKITISHSKNYVVCFAVCCS